MNANNVDAPTPPVGVIESLTLGFETVASRLVLVLLPILLDLVLWVGPRISFGPAVNTVVDAYHDRLWKPFVVSVEPEMDKIWPEIAEVMREALGSTVERDRKSTRLNSSHVKISYAVFCLKKKK